MPSWKRRTVALALGAILVLGASAPAMASSVAKDPKPPTRAACAAFVDYFQIEVLVALASGFAQAGNKKKSEKTANNIRDTFRLVLSPKLQQVTQTLADGTDPAVRTLFAQAAKAYGRGVALLEGAGLSKTQIAKLAKFDLKPDMDLQQVVGDVNLSKQKLKQAVKEFSSSFSSSAAQVDPKRATSKQRSGFQALSSSCGASPVEVDCSSIVTADEAAAFLGVAVTTENDDGPCTYTGPDDEDGRAAELAVSVWSSLLIYDQLTEGVPSQSVPGVGDAAVVINGFSTEGRGGTCGRTLFVKQGEHTVSVAACTGDTDPTTEALAGVANSVLARLP